MTATEMPDTQAVRLKTSRGALGTGFVPAAVAIAALAANRRPGKSSVGATT